MFLFGSVPFGFFLLYFRFLCADFSSLFLVLSSICFLPYFGQAHFALYKHCLCCPPSLWLSCVSLHVLPCGARGLCCVCVPAVSPLFCGRRHCLSTGLPADQRGIEPPPVVCPRRQVPAVSPRLSGFLRSSRCLCGPCCFLYCLSSLLWFLSLSCLPSLPRELSCLCSGPACILVCWYLPLGIWLSCDGSVALLSCWECG